MREGGVGLFDVAVNASVAAILRASDTGRLGAAANVANVARSDRIWVWATRRWGDRFVAAVAPRVFPAASEAPTR